MPVAIRRRDFLKRTAACALSTSLLSLAQEKAERPNIIFFLIDDQRNDTLGCAGHPLLKTPVVDDLAKNGVRFRNAFVTTSICAASRASLFTGLYETTHGYTFGKPPIRVDHGLMSYPAVLRRAGYRTGFIGKFGVGMPGQARKEMFDYFRPMGRNPYFKKQKDGTERHETQIDGDRAIDFLKSQPKDQPFCLSVSFNSVHAEDSDKDMQFPYPKVVADLYARDKMPLPRLNDPRIFESQPEFLRKSMNRQRYHWRWDTPEKYQKNMRNYFRMISGVDHVIGRVREALGKQGLAENTIIIYMGDNGYYMGDRGFAGKWSHYEESLRVPLIIYDPRSPASRRGTTSDAMALNVDVPATMLAEAGVEVPEHYQGRDLQPILNGKVPGDWRTDFFCEHRMKHPAIPQWEGVRDQRYVYARYVQQKPVYEFLHDLQTDPDQLRNFVDDPAYRETLAKMRSRCDQLRDEYKADREKKLDVPAKP
jgi:arylsulfatase A-like enzyme